MAFPSIMSELKPAGYVFIEHRKCHGEDCDAEIELYRTPRGKRMPFEVMPNANSPVIAHWKSCPNANDFRRD